MSGSAGVTFTALEGLRVLIVEDEPPIRETLREFLIHRGCAVTVAGDGAQAVSALRADPDFEVVITDLRLPVGDGVEVLRFAKERNPSGYVLMMTGFASLESAIEAVRFGAFEYLVKPFSLSELDLTMKRLAEHRCLTSDNRRLSFELERLRPFDRMVERQEALERSMADLVSEVRAQGETLAAVLGAFIPGRKN